VLILRSGAAGALRLAIVKEIARTAIATGLVLVPETDIEPDGGIEGAVLVQGEPGELVVKGLGGRRVREVAIRAAPIGNGAGDAMNELADRRFAPAGVRIMPFGRIAIKVLGDGDLRRERAPAFRHLYLFLPEDGAPGIIGDFRGSLLPFAAVEGRCPRGTENALEPQPCFRLGSFRNSARGLELHAGGKVAETRGDGMFMRFLFSPRRRRSAAQVKAVSGLIARSDRRCLHSKSWRRRDHVAVVRMDHRDSAIRCASEVESVRRGVGTWRTKAR